MLFRNLFDVVYREAEGGGAGDPPPNDDGKSRTVYTAEEFASIQAKLRETREEAKGHRLNHQNERARAEQLAAELEAERAARQADSAKHAERATRAELKAAAIAAGMNDPADAMAMVPMDQIKLNEDGDPSNLAELMAALKESKPYLFRVDGQTPRDSTSNPAKPPKPGDPKPKLATEMTDEEYAAAKAAITRRR